MDQPMKKYRVAVDKHNNYVIMDAPLDYKNPYTWEEAVSLLKDLAKKRKDILKEYS